MYLKINNETYPCVFAPLLSGDTLQFTLPDRGPEELGATMELYQDDGFLLWEAEVSKYLRWEYKDGVLTITNLPEPEPVPNPDPLPPPEVGPAPVPQLSSDELASAVVDLMFEVDTVKLKMGGF